MRSAPNIGTADWFNRDEAIAVIVYTAIVRKQGGGKNRLEFEVEQRASNAGTVLASIGNRTGLWNLFHLLATAETGEQEKSVAAGLVYGAI